MRKLHIPTSLWFVCLSLLVIPLRLYSTEKLQANQAINYVGTTQTVCGRVVSPKNLSGHPKAPTFLNLDQPYPNQVFTALIWGSDRFKFSYQPELKLNGKAICVSGVISNYKGKAQIIVTDPSQIDADG